ncbi:MAG: hypothetical protein ACP5E5_06400 [Acidobacteriaceae bacterium]
MTISNGGLSVTFNLAWGAVVIGIANKNVADGLNIVDYRDVGRELQVDEFLKLEIKGRKELIVNPTQAGAAGYQGYYQHPQGIVFPERGSDVVQWKAGPNHFHAMIKPLDYDTGNPTHWEYVEDVTIDSRGVAHFQYRFYNHESKTYIMATEVPTLYSDRTDAFLYPLVSPTGESVEALGSGKRAHLAVKQVGGSPTWPQKAIRSGGWIANIDTADNLGIFYTTPVGFRETFGTFPHADISDRLPLGKTNVAAQNLISYPGEIYSVEFSVLVSTPQKGPALISGQPKAVFKIEYNKPPVASKATAR